MAKRLNKKIVGGLAAVLFAAVVLGAYVALLRLQPSDPAQFVELATLAAGKGEWDEAALFFLRAARVSDDPSYLVRAGDMSLEAGQLAFAHDFWQQARTQRPEFLLPRERLLDLALQISRLNDTPANWAVVEREAQEILAQASDHAAALHALGLALIKAREQSPGNLDRGVESLRRAAERAPDDVDYTIDLAAYARLNGQDAEAERLYRDLVARHPQGSPDAARCRWVYADFLSTRQRPAEAEELYKQAISMAGGEGEPLGQAHLRYAMYLMRRWAESEGESEAALRQTWFDDAQAALEASIRAWPEGMEAPIQQAKLLLAADRFDDALAACEKRLAAPISQAGVQQFYDREYQYRLMLQASDVCLAAARAAQSADRDRWVSRADTFVASALALSSTGALGLLQKGRVLLEQGHDREALEALKSADEAYESQGLIHWGNKTLLADLHLRLNEPGTARRLLEAVLARAEREQADSAVFWVLYAQALLETNDSEPALQMVNRAIEIEPDHPAALDLKFRALQKLNRLDEAESLTRQVGGGQSASVVLHSRALSAGGDADGQIHTLTAFLKDHPADSVALREAVSVLLERGQRDSAEALVRKAEEAAPQDAAVRSLALAVRPAESPEALDREVSELIEADPDPLARHVRLAIYHDNRGRPSEAMAALKQARAELDGRSAQLAPAERMAYERLLLGGTLVAAAKLEDWDAAQKAVDAAAALNADGAEGRVFQGRLYLMRNQPGQALGAFREALRTQPTNVTLLTLAGGACESLRQYDDARTYYQQALDANPNHAAAHRGMAAVALALQEPAAYARHLDICRKLIPDDLWVRQQLLHEDEQRRPAEAVKRREAYLADHPDDQSNLIRLARLCILAGEREKADDYYGRLLDQRGDDQLLMFEAAEHFRATGRPQRAAELIQTFISTRATPEDAANARLSLAAMHARQGDVTAARAALEEAAAVAETFEVCLSLADLFLTALNDPAAALPWYDKAVSLGRAAGKVRLPEAHLRRITAALHDRLLDTERAQRCVEEFEKDAAGSPAAILARCEVQVRQGDLEGALDTLNRRLADRADDVTALFRRGDLYAKMERWPDAAADLERVKAMDPDAHQFRPRMLLARAYENTGRADLAHAELESIVRDHPAAAQVALELVNAYRRAQRPADAARVCTGMINRLSGAAAAPWHALRADAAFRSGDADAALDDLRQAATLTDYDDASVLRLLEAAAASGRPAAGIEFFEAHRAGARWSAPTAAAYGVLLARSQRVDEAVAVFKAAMQKAVDESYSAVARVGQLAMTALPAERVQAEFQAAARAEPPDPIAVRFMAAFDEQQGRWQDSVDALEGLLGTESDSKRRLGLLLQQAVMYQLHQEPSRARACYERALEIDGDDVIALNNLADLLANPLDQPQLALEHARRAVFLHPAPDLRDTLGWILVRTEDYPQAVAQLGKAAADDPARAVFRYHLGEAYRRWGKTRQARDSLLAAQRLARSAGDEALAAEIDAALARVE